VAGLALQAHALLAPSVPLVGWDVALPADTAGGEASCLLELNISCNLFNGSYDRWAGAPGSPAPAPGGVARARGAAPCRLLAGPRRLVPP
jgi:hypothetical protein